LPDANFELFQKAAEVACKKVIEAEPEITKFDTIAGDGDCGLTYKAMAEGVIKAFNEGKVDKTDVTSALADIAAVVGAPSRHHIEKLDLT
jgi:dihydroxyacetone kinase